MRGKMARKLESDLILFGAILVLVLFGLVMVFSASAVMASERYGSSYYFVFRQGIWAALGILVMVAVMNIDYRQWRNPQFIFPALALLWILLVAVYLTPRWHETHRWFHVGPLNFQPSELAKILILKEPDLGTSLAICLICAAMLFAAGLHLRYFVGATAAAVPLLYVVIFHVAYRHNRLLGFLHPESDPLGKGFQMLQSLIAVGSGGILGVGLMEGRQKLFFLPEPQTDFIYAVISEEWGFIGATLVLVVFAVILWRGLRAAVCCSDHFGKLLAVGITVLLVGQALVNMSVVIGLLPTKGIPLPFISYGGSSLLMNLIAAGVLLNISQHATGEVF